MGSEWSGFFIMVEIRYKTEEPEDRGVSTGVESQKSHLRSGRWKRLFKATALCIVLLCIGLVFYCWHLSEKIERRSVKTLQIEEEPSATQQRSLMTKF